MNYLHVPVLADFFKNKIKKQKKFFVDATFGRGGHTRIFLEKGFTVLALDFDKQAIDFGKQEFKDFIQKRQLILKRENFSNIDKTIQKNIDQSQIQGILFDLGASTDQLKSQHRGFSFLSDSGLDMRMDDRLNVKASDLLNILSQKQLIYMFRTYAQEEKAKQIAKKIIEFRKKQPILTTLQLADLVSSVKKRKGKLHPATKVFQALRIVVNNELDNISTALDKLKNLKLNAFVYVISFHEGEDRIVKNKFKSLEQSGFGEIITKKPIQPTEQEIEKNPNSRSAKLRIFYVKS